MRIDGSFQNWNFPQNNFWIRVKVKAKVKVKVKVKVKGGLTLPRQASQKQQKQQKMQTKLDVRRQNQSWRPYCSDQQWISFFVVSQTKGW